MKSQKCILEKSAESMKEPAGDICVWVTVHLNIPKTTEMLCLWGSIKWPSNRIQDDMVTVIIIFKAIEKGCFSNPGIN